MIILLSWDERFVGTHDPSKPGSGQKIEPVMAMVLGF